MKTVFLSISIVLLLAGCATTPTPLAEAKQAPQSRILAYQEKKAETTSTLVVTRDAGFLGGGCYYGLSINGILAARLDVGETSRFYLSPGEILLRVGRDPLGNGLCAAGQDEWTQRETVLKQHEMKFFRLSIDANGKTDIQRADQ
ncbi:MAG: hypothetical protein ACYCZJ_12810 [Sulfuriferula sp.]